MLDTKTFFIEVVGDAEPTEEQLIALVLKFKSEETRTVESILMDRINAQQQREELNLSRKRFPVEAELTNFCLFSDKQQNARRNIEALISVRKHLKEKGEADLEKEVNTQLLTFAKYLSVGPTEVDTKLEAAILQD
jgi:hypothetical protein